MSSMKKGSRQKYAVRLDAAAKLIAAYVKLSENCKKMFEGFLAVQVYDSEVIYPYLVYPEDLLVTEVLSTFEYPQFIHVAWANWARQIRESALADFEGREAVRAMLGVLIRLKERKRLKDSDLSEAAKATLGWTRRDARGLEWLQFVTRTTC